MRKPKYNCSYNQSGTYLILLPAIIIAILAGLAISMNTGNAVADRQRAQSASDAAALAGAFAVKREMPNLTSEDLNINKDALERVNKAVRVAAADNGFEHGVDGIQVNATWPPVYPNGDTEAYYEGEGNEFNNYIRVTVEKPVEYLFFKGILSSLPAKNIGAAAVGRVGVDGQNNSCPGLYIFGDGPNKVLNLTHDSQFLINQGGIFISGDGKALYGADSLMTADWIELNGTLTKSVVYDCLNPPPTHTSCPEIVSVNRKPPVFDDVPDNTCSDPSDTNTETRCINGGIDFGTCSASECAKSKSCVGMACLPSKGCKKDCLTTCTGTTPTAINRLEAGQYCDGLSIINTGTEAVPFRLEANASSKNNTFNLNGSNMLILNSQIEASPAGVVDADGKAFEGVEILTLVSDIPQNLRYATSGAGNEPQFGLIKIGDSSSTDSTLEGSLRIYSNAVYLDYSKLVIDNFDREGCGKLPDITTTVVQ